MSATDSNVGDNKSGRPDATGRGAKSGDGSSQRTAASNKGGGTRSPNYPQASLPQALELARRIYDRHGTRIITDEDAVGALGYNGLNGTSKVKLSALKKFALLVPVGDGNKISDEGRWYFDLGPEDPDVRNALRRLALRPAAFKTLNDKFPEMPSEGILRSFLVRNGFHSEGANQLIRFYQSTMEFVEALEGAPTLNNAKNEPKVEDNARVAKPGSPPPSNQVGVTEPAERTAESPGGRPASDIRPNSKRYAVPLSPQCEAEVVLIGEITQEAINTLQEYLDIAKRAFPMASNGDPTRPATTTTKATPPRTQNVQTDESEDDGFSSDEDEGSELFATGLFEDEGEDG